MKGPQLFILSFSSSFFLVSYLLCPALVAGSNHFNVLAAKL
jgi:hypothetical protein